MGNNNRVRFYEYLPAIYQRGDFLGEADFLKKFLKGFEDVLLGREADDDAMAEKGLVEVLERISDYFAPDRAPDEFIEWLAGWVALDVGKNTDGEDSDEQEKDGASVRQYYPYEEEKRSRRRHLIRKIAPIYHLRGTREGLRQIIDIYFGDDLRSFHINELIKPFVVGDPEGLEKVRADYARCIGEEESGIDFSKISISTLLARENYDALGAVVGRSTVVGEAPTYYFILYAENLLPVSRVAAAYTKRGMAAVIDLEKPAHTYYALKLRVPGMRVGIRDWCEVGKSTLIGGLEI